MSMLGSRRVSCPGSAGRAPYCAGSGSAPPPHADSATAKASAAATRRRPGARGDGADRRVMAPLRGVGGRVMARLRDGGRRRPTTPPTPRARRRCRTATGSPASSPSRRARARTNRPGRARTSPAPRGSAPSSRRRGPGGTARSARTPTPRRRTPCRRRAATTRNSSTGSRTCGRRRCRRAARRGTAAAPPPPGRRGRGGISSVGRRRRRTSGPPSLGRSSRATRDAGVRIASTGDAGSRADVRFTAAAFHCAHPARGAAAMPIRTLKLLLSALLLTGAVAAAQTAPPATAPVQPAPQSPVPAQTAPEPTVPAEPAPEASAPATAEPVDRADTTQTPDEAAAEVAAHPPGHSGFRLLSTPTNALMSRVALADQAARTIDLQTYIYNDDASGRLVANHLLKAADRGVAVRLLVDAFDSPDPNLFDALDAHENIEVRLFNPFRTRDPGTLSALGQMLLEFARLNRRMHNKAFIVDGRVAVIGGRNIGDEYFDASDGANFRDLDLLAIGPVVGDARRAFDTYWNGETAVPLHAFGSERREPEHLEDLREDIADSVAELSESDYAEALVAELPNSATATRAGKWFWGPAELVADHPDKAEVDGDAPGLRIGPRLRQVLDAAQSEVLMTTPYFVPGEDDVAHLVGLAKRGVDVAVLTNSMESTDHASVHGAYSERRRPLLGGGVRLFELRARPERAPSQAVAANDAQVALHAKSFVVDRRYVFVGSLNMDQRSELLNTEMGLLVDNAELAAAVAKYFEIATRPTTAYEVVVDENGGDLHWISEEDGERVDHSREPNAGIGRRAGAALGRLLPVDNLL